MTTDEALVRRPGPRLADGLVTHMEKVPVDAAAAVEQWHGYVAALERCGWATYEVPPADDCPDAVFVEDTMVVYRDLAVMTRPGAPQRRDEVAAAEIAVQARGYRTARVDDPGTLDGGDVLKVADTVYVGRGGRTNAAGLEQLRALLEPLGATVIGVPVSKVLHLKSAVTALPDGTVIGYPPLVDDTEVFPDFLPVPEEAGAHVVLLGAGRLLMSASAPRTAELLEGRGYTPVVVDIGEFEKLEGCVTCLSVRLRRPGREEPQP
jgi:dimethylargininase